MEYTVTVTKETLIKHLESAKADCQKHIDKENESIQKMEKSVIEDPFKKVKITECNAIISSYKNAIEVIDRQISIVLDSTQPEVAVTLRQD